jgi:hypothetical protein
MDCPHDQLNERPCGYIENRLSKVSSVPGNLNHIFAGQNVANNEAAGHIHEPQERSRTGFED